MKKLLTGVLIAALAVGGVAYAQDDTGTTFLQNILAGVLTVDILDETGTAVAEPSVAMDPVNVSVVCQEPGSTGTLGVDGERIYVENPDAAEAWNLSIAATGGSTAEWDSGDQTMSYNDATDDGCDTGQLSVDPTTGTITPDCDGNCDNTGIATGSAASFDNGVVDSVELINAGIDSNQVWRGYLTGVDLAQVIPGGQPSGEYGLDMTLTVVAD